MPQFVGPNPYWAEYKANQKVLQRGREDLEKAWKQQDLQHDMTLLGQALSPNRSTLSDKRLHGSATSPRPEHPTKQTSGTSGQPDLTTQLANSMGEFKTLEGMEMAGNLMQAGWKQRQQTKRAIGKARAKAATGLRDTAVDKWVRAELPNGKAMQVPLPKNQQQAMKMLQRFPEGTKLKEGLTEEEGQKEYRNITMYDPKGEPVKIQVPEGPQGNKQVLQLYQDERWSFLDPASEQSGDAVLNLKRALGAIQKKWKSKDADAPTFNFSKMKKGMAASQKDNVSTLIGYLKQKADKGLVEAKVDLLRMKRIEDQMMEVLGVGVPDDVLKEIRSESGGQKKERTLQLKDGKLIDPNSNEEYELPDYTFTE